MTVKPINSRGRKAKVGGVCYDGTRLAFFAGYNNCQECGIEGKVLISIDDARTLGQKFGNYKEPLGVKVARRLARHYQV
jgi:hypothetical protein